MTLRVTIRCPLCGATRKRLVYGYQDVATWTDSETETVRCHTCGNEAVEIVVDAQGQR